MRDPVDAFLAEMSAAPVPASLAARVVEELRRTRQQPRRPTALWLAAAALVAAALAVVVGVAAPDPTPVPPAPPESPIATQSAEGTPALTQSPPPLTPEPTEPAPGRVFEVEIPSHGQTERLRLRIVDESGRIVEARPAERDPAFPDDAMAVVLEGRGEASLIVGWMTFACDERAELRLAVDGRTLTVGYPPRPGCDTIPAYYAVELVFSGPVDPGTFNARQLEEPIVDVDDLLPSTIGFADADAGWVGGTTQFGDALIVATRDGGTTWTTGGFGSGTVVDIAAGTRENFVAGRECGDDLPRCRNGSFNSGDGGPSQTLIELATDLSLSGRFGAGIFLAPEPELRTSEDFGVTWRSRRMPCPEGLVMDAVSRTDANTLYGLCSGDGAGGGQAKALLVSTDAGASWSTRAETEGGGLPQGGTDMSLSMAPDSSGWLWGARSALLHTVDGGATWQPLDLVDGDVRIVLDAEYLGGSAGLALVHDPSRGTLLLRTEDGETWRELRIWPLETQIVPQLVDAAVDWNERAEVVGLDGDYFRVVAFGGRLLAVGTPPGDRGFERSIFSSSDGRNWQVVADRPFDNHIISDIFVAGERLVVTGIHPDPDDVEAGWPVVWWSDDGADWHLWADVLAGDPPMPTRLAPLGDRWAGAMEGGLAVSEDGNTWRQTMASGARFAGFAAGPGGLVAAAVNEDVLPFRSSVFFTADGLEWAESSLAGDTTAIVEAVAANEDGFVAVGVVRTDRFEPAAWWSPNGVTWSRADWTRVPLLPAPMQIPVVVPYRGGYLAVGAGDLANRVRWSADGRRWTPQPAPPEALDSWSVAVLEDTVHLFGLTEASDPIVWVGRRP